MDYAAEDSQNSAPGSVEAAKFSSTRKGPDAQSVTKRYAVVMASNLHSLVIPCTNKP